MSTDLELTIERPAFGGAGIARLDGRVAFVEGALPGSRVAARIVKDDKNLIRAVTTRVIAPSPHAVEPFCHHFGTCGGCSWQDAAYEAQLIWKREIVIEQIKRLGGLDAPVAQTIPSPLERLYRNKMEFAFGPGRTGLVSLGLRERFTPGRIAEIEACFLMPAPVMDILAAVRRHAAKLSLPPYFARTGTGAWRHLVLRRSESSGRWLAQFITGPKTPFKRLRPMCEALLKEFPVLSGVVVGIRRDRSDYAIAETQAFAVGEDHLTEELDGLKLRLSAEAFFQTNTQAAAALYAKAVQAARLTGSETVWDLYCGVGGLSLFLARWARSVTGFEIAEAAVEDAAANAAENGFTNCSFAAGDLKDALARRKARPDVIVLDPPRAGLHPDSLQALTRIGAPRMVYVSCNPSTLARDLGRFSGAYAVREVTPVDMFPHTPHVECVAELERAG